MDAIVSHPEAEPGEARVGGGSRHAIRQVDQHPAAIAHEVMVPIDAGVEAGHGALVGNLPKDLYPDQGFEGTVDRGPRQPRQTGGDGREDVVHRGMVRPAEQGFEDQASLHRQRQGAGAAQRLGTSHPLLEKTTFLHRIPVWEFISSSLGCQEVPVCP